MHLEIKHMVEQFFRKMSDIIVRKIDLVCSLQAKLVDIPSTVRLESNFYRMRHCHKTYNDEYKDWQTHLLCTCWQLNEFPSVPFDLFLFGLQILVDPRNSILLLYII